jgi:HEAT repeat protein
MSDDLFFDSIFKLASDLSESLIDAGINHLHLAELIKGEAVALHAVLDEGFVALLTDIYGQLPDGDNHREQLASIQNALHTFFRQPDIAESILSSVISGNSPDSVYLTERCKAMTSEPEIPSLDFSQSLNAFFLVAASNWQMTLTDGSSRTSYNVFIGRNLGPLAIGDHAQATTSDDSEPRVGQDLAASEVRYRDMVVERYNKLGFGGLGQVDLRLSEIALEDVFVRLSLTVEKVVLEQISSEEREPDQHRHGWWGRGEWRDREATRATKESEQQRERIVVVQESITLTDALTQNALIVGEPGAGKSTLLRWLAVTFAAGRQQEADRLGAQADADRLPLLVELGRLPERYLQAESRETPDWEKFLPEHIAAQPSFHAIPATLLAAALTAGRGLLLCDGLDEIADLSARRRIADSLAEYARRSANRLVLSSRPAGVSGSEGVLGGRFQRITIQRFTPADVQRFFRFWYALDTSLAPDEQSRQADAIFAKVKGAPKTLELAGTPLLATLLLLIWRNEGDLPERRVELYERCCRMLIESWEAHHDVAYTGVLRDIGWERHLRLLAPLAYTIHSTEQRTDAPLAELAPVLAHALQAEGLAGANATLEAEKFLRALSLRSGLLQFLGSDRYGFPHLTFQEYLAARHIAAQPDPDYIDLVMVHLHEAWWREVHLLVIGHLGSSAQGADKASRLMLTILNLYRPPWRILRARRVRWWNLPAIASRALASRVDWQWERRVAWMVARELNFVATGYLECNSLGTNGELRHSLFQRTEHLLLQAARDSARIATMGDEALFLSVGLLGQLGQTSPAVVAGLVHALGDSDRGVRSAAADSLGRLGQTSPEVVAGLVHALGDSDEGVRSAAADSLVKLSQTSPAVVAGLVHALGDSDRGVRRAAAASLVKLGQTSPAVVVVLVHALGDSDRYVRSAAADSLVKLGQTSPAVVVVLVHALGASHWDVQSAAADSLVKLGQTSPEAVAALVHALGDSDRGVRSAAADSLVKLGQTSPGAVAALVHALGDSDGYVRSAAADSLGKLGQTAPAMAALVHALGDADGYVRSAAADSLGRLGQTSPEAVAALVHALGDSDWYMRRAAADSLGKLGQTSPAAVAGLVHALGDSDRGVRRAAADSLGKLGQTSPEVVAALVHALGDSDGYVRRAAADSLGKLGQTAPAMAALVHALGDSDWYMRRAAADSLGKLGQTSPEVVAGLVHALGDSDRGVRSAAADSLVKLGQTSPEAVAALVHALGDSDGYVRRAAADSLGKLGQTSPEAVAGLVHALGDSDRDVRRAAADSLVKLGQTSPEAVAGLVHALGDSDRDVRSAAADSLGKLGQTSPEVVAALVHALGDSDRDVRRAAADSLGKLGQTSPEVVAALVHALGDSDWYVRRAAAVNLGKLGQPSPEAVAALAHALGDSDSYVRRAAADSLGKLGQKSPEMVAALVHALGDSDGYVRSAAAVSLGEQKIEPETELRRVLIVLNYRLHDSDDDVRRTALETTQKILDGRPIPGYRWVPLRQRRERARRRRIAGYWVLGIATVLLLAWLAAVVTTQVAVDPFVERFVTALLALVALTAGAVQVLAWFRRPFWDR